MEDQLAIEIELDPTDITFRDGPMTVKRGLSTETRQLRNIGKYREGTFNIWMLPIVTEPKIGESIFILADEYKITERESLGYGYHLTVEPVK